MVMNGHAGRQFQIESLLRLTALKNCRVAMRAAKKWRQKDEKIRMGRFDVLTI
jgi:hypothetical protein